MKGSRALLLSLLLVVGLSVTVWASPGTRQPGTQPEPADVRGAVHDEPVAPTAPAKTDVAEAAAPDEEPEAKEPKDGKGGPPAWKAVKDATQAAWKAAKDAGDPGWKDVKEAGKAEWKAARDAEKTGKAASKG